MRALTLLLLCLLSVGLWSVGAWGQTTAQNPIFIQDAKPIVDLPATLDLYAPKEHSNATCTCTFSDDGTHMSCSPINACVDEIMRKMSPDPVDVPAIPVLDLAHTSCTKDNCVPDAQGVIDWTCRDKTRTLMETLDGKTHYCHKPQL